jgi:predicted branched-subunit amino acid permease
MSDTRADQRPTGASDRGRLTSMSPDAPADVPTPRDGRLLLRSVVVGVAVGAFGVAFGVTAVASGLPGWFAVLSSVIVFAGASQFAFVAVAAAGDPFTGAVSGILLNLRIIAFSLALAPRLGPASVPGRLLDGYLITDESAAIAFEGDRAGTRRRLRTAGASVGLFWVATTALGAFGGDLLGDVTTLGLDVAFPAAFIALLGPALRRPVGRRIAVGGAVLAVLAMQVLPAGLTVLAAGLAVLPFVRHGQEG